MRMSSTEIRTEASTGEREGKGIKEGQRGQLFCFLTLFLRVIYSPFFKGWQTASVEPNLSLYGLLAKNVFNIV